MDGSGSAYYDAYFKVFDMATSRTGSESAHAVVLLCSGFTFIGDDMITCDTELLAEEFEHAGCSVERDFDDALCWWGYRVYMPGRVRA